MSIFEDIFSFSDFSCSSSSNDKSECFNEEQIPQILANKQTMGQ